MATYCCLSCTICHPILDQEPPCPSISLWPVNPLYASVPIKTVKILQQPDIYILTTGYWLLLGTVGPSLRRSWQLRSQPGAASRVNSVMKCYFLLTAQITDLVFGLMDKSQANQVAMVCKYCWLTVLVRRLWLVHLLMSLSLFRSMLCSHIFIYQSKYVIPHFWR